MDIPHRSSWKRFLLTASVLMSWSFPGAAQLTIIPQPSIAVVGADVLLSLHGLQEGSYASVTWFQGIGFVRSILSYDTETETTITGPAFTDREVLQSNGSLIIRGVKVTDSGNYTIIVNSKDNKLMWATQGFQVYVMPSKPSIIMEPGGSIIEFQSLVKFTCNPNEADVNIQWFLNNAELPLSPQLSLSSDNKILTFHNVTRGDSGYYQCKVWNSVGFQESDGINLIVFYGPDQVTITPDTGSIWGNIVGVEINSSLTLKCQAESNPAPDYTWYLNENSLGILESQYSISMASRNHDGNYKCTVDNRLAGKSASASVTVKVAEWVTKPHVLANTTSIVEDEGAVSFTCVTPDTEIEVQWLLDNQSLPANDRLVLSQGNRTLTITQVHREDAGQYQCTTRNLISSISSDPVPLTVNYGPDQINITRASGSSALNSIEITLGSTLTLLCSAPSQPEAQYHWSLNTTSSLEHAGSLLTIEAVTWDHQGTGMCSAWNNLTRLDRSATVTIRVVDSSLSSGAIVGIVIGVLVAVALLAGLVYFLVIRRRQRGSVGCRLHVASGDLHPSLCSALTTCMTLAHSVSGGAIAGIVIGVLAGVALTGALVYFLYIRKTRGASQGLLGDPGPGGKTQPDQKPSKVLENIYWLQDSNPSAQGLGSSPAFPEVPSESPYQMLDITKVDVYDKIIPWKNPQAQERGKSP
ncbi:carcinoembryonic antigen-related cell adhesion molecule 20-like [Vombatus ursinus]|uniref:carcinoembryonic antigen-related cell adhesion molecule 20-like n=1 Tax=Vombatus ursinus TaxID=29139 RepID=UPI000FFD6633|nr:carcinoembryonic antigen-related cell adhesion molecule 20-like [Vombatus ursinus]